MVREEAILDQWFFRAVATYPGETARFLGAETDRFRNPVGISLRENLEILLRELLGGMDTESLKSALEAVVRLRSVQYATATEAVGFIFSLRTIMQHSCSGFDRDNVDARIDRLALLAFEEYVRCREKLAELRLNESRRAMAVPVALARARS